MLSALLGARQKQQLHFAPAGHVNTREGCWNFLFSKAAFPSRSNTEMKAVGSLLSLPHGHSSPPGHALGVGSWSWLVPGPFSITANADICLCQTSQESFPEISRKCSDLPNARAKGTGHADGSLPLVTFSEPCCCNLTRMFLSSTRDCSSRASHLTGSPLIERFLYLLQKSYRKSTRQQVQEI